MPSRNRTELTDSTGASLGVSTVSGSRVLKVDVVQSVGGGGGSGQTQLIDDLGNPIGVFGNSLFVDAGFQPTQREEILSSDDCFAVYAWLDFGTSDERLSTITYTSATINPTLTLVKTFNYTFVSSVYRFDGFLWSIS